MLNKYLQLNYFNFFKMDMKYIFHIFILFTNYFKYSKEYNQILQTILNT